MQPLDTSIRAEYADGFILDETELNDINPYGDGNIFRAICNKEPEAVHGRLVKFSGFWKNARYDIDWTKLPDNARPIRFRHGYSFIDESGAVGSGFSGMDFGYQYNDADGKNHKDVVELR